MSLLFRWLTLIALTLGSAPVLWGQPSDACRQVKANVQNNGLCQTISTTPVTVHAANTSRCSNLIYNSSVNPMMCRDVSRDGAPTATAGMPIPAGEGRGFGLEGQGQWQCIRSAGADAIACSVEALP